jgi:Putative prokaryotic signal transducing protein
MYCPKCEKKFSWDVMICPTCDVETVDSLPDPNPGPDPTPDVNLVPVLTTGDSGIIGIAKSLLENAEIDYFVRGDGLQDLFGLGRLTGYSYLTGPAEFLVRADDAARAHELLDPLIAPATGET